MEDYWLGSQEERDLADLKQQLKEIQEAKARKFAIEQAKVEAERVRKQIEAYGVKPCR